ncbi:MAG: hypothetical protein JJU11_12640, partial [Candidatus Sumerlaeia bacterium]|nr:hypothetical protein [Candidatus Sumerlaeia bacterium]
MNTLEKLPDLSEPRLIDDSMVRDYGENGHVVVRHVATREEGAAYLPHIAEALEKNKKERRKLEERG